MTAIRQADVELDSGAVANLWRDYLQWGNDGLERRYGFRLPVEGAVQADLESIPKFQPPHGRLLLAFVDGLPVAVGCMRGIDPETAEVKRMWVDPAYRRRGLGRELLEHLIDAARERGYRRVRLDSPDFMTAAHALYRSFGFAEIDPYPESEIPERYRDRWIFMELSLT